MNHKNKSLLLTPFIALTLLLAGLSGMAFAQTAHGQVIAQEPVFDDSITMELAAEDWLSTSTAKVYVRIVAVFDQKQSANIRQRVQNELAKLAPDTDWRFTGFYRTEGSAGFEQWTINAESRIADRTIDGLRARLDKASRTGFEMELQRVAYTPSEAEKQDHFRHLRKKIYQMAQEELKNLRETFPDRKYRITQLSFSPSALQYQRAQTQAKTLDDKVLESYRVNRDSDGQQMNISQKVRLHATLVLGTAFRPTKE